MRVFKNVLLDFVYILHMNTYKLIIWILKPYASFGILMWILYVQKILKMFLYT